MREDLVIEGHTFRVGDTIEVDNGHHTWLETVAGLANDGIHAEDRKGRKCRWFYDQEWELWFSDDGQVADTVQPSFPRPEPRAPDASEWVGMTTALHASWRITKRLGATRAMRNCWRAWRYVQEVTGAG